MTRQTITKQAPVHSRKRQTVRHTGVIPVYGCHNCAHGSYQRCLACRRVDRDDECIRKKPHALEKLAVSKHLQSDNVCEIWDDKSEQTLQFFCDVANLEPLDLLALITFARGGSEIDIGKALAKLSTRLRRYTVTKYDAGRNYRTIDYKPKTLISRATVYAALKNFKARMETAVELSRRFGKGAIGRMIYSPERLAYIARAALDEIDITLLSFSLHVRGLGLTDIGLTLGQLAEPGGLCDRMIDKFSNPDNLTRYAQALMRRFSKYADIIRDAFPDWRFGL